MRLPTRSILARSLVAVPFLGLLMGSEGNCTLLQDTLRSPVQAVTTIVEHPDGSVRAQVVIISTEGGDEFFVDSAENVELRMPSGDKIALKLTDPGTYSAHSGDTPGLVYEPGATYRTSFDLDDEKAAGDAAGDDFIAIVEAPADEVTFELAKPPAFAGDTAQIEWTPSNLAGLFEVRDAGGALIFSSFDWSHPEFDGSKWGSLILGGSETLRVDVFAEPGTYTLSFCAVNSREGFEEEVSAGLGILSGFMAGRCVEDITIDVPE